MFIKWRKIPSNFCLVMKHIKLNANEQKEIWSHGLRFVIEWIFKIDSHQCKLAKWPEQKPFHSNVKVYSISISFNLIFFFLFLCSGYLFHFFFKILSFICLILSGWYVVDLRRHLENILSIHFIVVSHDLLCISKKTTQNMQFVCGFHFTI